MMPRLSNCRKCDVACQLVEHFRWQWATLILLIFIFIRGAESNESYKTMTAQDVADAMNSEQLCTATISDDACLSSVLMNASEWNGGIRQLKDSILSKFNESLCVKTCSYILPNNKTVERCGPFYFYLTSFSVLRGGMKKADFAEKFSRDLFSDLNSAEQKKNGGKACDGVFLFFFSRVDRLIALRAPYSSYLYDYQSEVYQGVKGFYTKAMDQDGYSFEQAVYETFETIDKCLKKQDGFCTSKPHSKKKNKPLTVILFIVGCAVLMGIVIASAIFCKSASQSDSSPAKVKSSRRSSISSASSASSPSQPASDRDEGDNGGDC